MNTFEEFSVKGEKQLSRTLFHVVAEKVVE